MPRPADLSASLAPHQHLARILTGDHATDAYHWHHVMAMMHFVTGTRTAHHERVLARAAISTRPLVIDDRRGMPHSLPPEEVVRLLAVQALAEWDVDRHSDVLHHVVRTAEHNLVRQIAGEALKARRDP